MEQKSPLIYRKSIVVLRTCNSSNFRSYRLSEGLKTSESKKLGRRGKEHKYIKSKEGTRARVRASVCDAEAKEMLRNHARISLLRRAGPRDSMPRSVNNANALTSERSVPAGGAHQYSLAWRVVSAE